MRIKFLFCFLIFFLSFNCIAQVPQNSFDSSFKDGDAYFDDFCNHYGIDLSFDAGDPVSDRDFRREKLRKRYENIHREFIHFNPVAGRDSVVDEIDKLIVNCKYSDHVIMTKHDYLWMCINVYINAYEDAGGSICDMNFEDLKRIIIKESNLIDSNIRFLKSVDSYKKFKICFDRNVVN